MVVTKEKLLKKLDLVKTMTELITSFNLVIMKL